MNSKIAVRLREGSHEAQTALTALAQRLRMNESALKVVLARAFDILPRVGGIPMLALRESFNSFHRPLNKHELAMVRGVFCGAFSAPLGVERDTSVPIARIHRTPYRELCGTETSRPLPTARMNPNPYRTLVTTRNFPPSEVSQAPTAGSNVTYHM
jgi:hypothetical protein